MTSTEEARPGGAPALQPATRDVAGGGSVRKLVMAEAVLGVLLLGAVAALGWLVLSVPSRPVSAPIAKRFFSVVVPRGWQIATDAKDYVDLYSAGNTNLLTLQGGLPKAGFSDHGVTHLDSVMCGLVNDVPDAKAIQWTVVHGVTGPESLSPVSGRRAVRTGTAPPGSSFHFTYSLAYGAQEGPVTSWKVYSWVAVTSRGRHLYEVIVRDSPDHFPTFLRAAVPVALGTHWRGWSRHDVSLPPRDLRARVRACLKDRGVRQVAGSEVPVLQEVSAA